MPQAQAHLLPALAERAGMHYQEQGNGQRTERMVHGRVVLRGGEDTGEGWAMPRVRSRLLKGNHGQVQEEPQISRMAQMNAFVGLECRERMGLMIGVICDLRFAFPRIPHS
jgi:hypothetical protein